MVYSTCTFSAEEDEGTVCHFLKQHPEFQLEEAKKFPGMVPGMAVVGQTGNKEIKKTIRLWPHKLKGEGHFVACFRKDGEMSEGVPFLYGEEKGISLKECGEWDVFSRQYLHVSLKGRYLKFGDQLYLIPENTPSLNGMKVLRPGLHLGTLKKNRFEPSHALALSLQTSEAVYKWDLSVKEAAAYLAGEIFPAQGEKGWYLITTEGYSLGWGKLAGGVMKNHYPKGLRK